MYFFCFKQKTAYEMRISDWSSDVCSSDLIVEIGDMLQARHRDHDIAGAIARTVQRDGILGRQATGFRQMRQHAEAAPAGAFGNDPEPIIEQAGVATARQSAVSGKCGAFSVDLSGGGYITKTT